MKRTLASIGIFLFILGLISIAQTNSGLSYTGYFVTDNGNNVSVNLKVADTPAERKKGLMNTFWLPKKQGMIFIFEDEEMRSFWMKNTYMPLDIVFLDEDFRVINIETASPQPFTSDINLKRYKSDNPAKYVIELNKGFTDSKNISEGDFFFSGRNLQDCCI